MDLNKLKEKMPYKWKPQTCNSYCANCVGYIDSRQAQSKLDEVCGGENWQDMYYEVANNLYCSIGIKVGDEWIRKSDCGVESNMDKEKGQASDAFKRAAVKWGVGRFLYNLKLVQINSTKNKKGKYMPADKNGKAIWDKDRLTEICFAKQNGTAPPAKPQPANDTPPPSKVTKRQGEVLDAITKFLRTFGNKEPDREKIKEIFINTKGYLPDNPEVVDDTADWLHRNYKDVIFKDDNNG